MYFTVKPHARASQPAQRRTWMSFLRRNQEERRFCLTNRPCHRDRHQVILSGAKRDRQTSTRQYRHRIRGQFRCRLRHFQFQKEQPSSNGLYYAADGLRPAVSRIHACQTGQKRQQNGHFSLKKSSPEKTKHKTNQKPKNLAPAGPGFYTTVIISFAFFACFKKENGFFFLCMTLQ